MPLRNLLASLLACGACGREPPAPDDRLEIAQVLTSFSAAVNRHDWNTMSDLFAEDAVWEASAGDLGFRHEGRDAIRRFLHGNEENVEVLYYSTGASHIELVGPDRARATTPMIELLRLPRTGEEKELFGVYRDELVKIDGRWLFASRAVDVRRQLVLGGGGAAR
jgi:uncharacterized protein (TIGR02246 family)